MRGYGSSVGAEAQKRDGRELRPRRTLAHLVHQRVGILEDSLGLSTRISDKGSPALTRYTLDFIRIELIDERGDLSGPAIYEVGNPSACLMPFIWGE